MNLFKKYGLKVPNILLPAKSNNLKTWAVIACDQYTQDTEYWKNVSDTVGSNASTLHIVLPEVYLDNTEKKDEFIQSIRATMTRYLTTGIFQDELSCFMYIERQTNYNRTRKGLVVAIDLETYDWKPFSKNLIRATEATIIDRIPPRVAIRNGAPIESPHIMLLVNDPDALLVEKIGNEISKEQKTYDTDLMLHGGHISGWAIQKESDFEKIEQSLETIAKKNTEKDGSIFMFAVGDGNHSLATAKAVWDEKKATCCDTENALERFALVEIVNIFDEGLTFEPIHRVLFNIESEKLITFIRNHWAVDLIEFDSFEKLEAHIEKNPASFAVVRNNNGTMLYTCITTDKKGLLVSHLQPLIDDFMQGKNSEDIDYIHGSEELCRLGKKEGTVALFLPPIEKDSFFETIAINGPLPRKSFSMGEADEKRFYMECRKLHNEE